MMVNVLATTPLFIGVSISHPMERNVQPLSGVATIRSVFVIFIPMSKTEIITTAPSIIGVPILDSMSQSVQPSLSVTARQSEDGGKGKLYPMTTMRENGTDAPLLLGSLFGNSMSAKQESLEGVRGSEIPVAEGVQVKNVARQNRKTAKKAAKAARVAGKLIDKSKIKYVEMPSEEVEVRLVEEDGEGLGYTNSNSNVGVYWEPAAPAVLVPLQEKEKKKIAYPDMNAADRAERNRPTRADSIKYIRPRAGVPMDHSVNLVQTPKKDKFASLPEMTREVSEQTFSLGNYRDQSTKPKTETDRLGKYPQIPGGYKMTIGDTVEIDLPKTPKEKILQAIKRREEEAVEPTPKPYEYAEETDALAKARAFVKVKAAERGVLVQNGLSIPKTVASQKKYLIAVGKKLQTSDCPLLEDVADFATESYRLCVFAAENNWKLPRDSNMIPVVPRPVNGLSVLKILRDAPVYNSTATFKTINQNWRNYIVNYQKTLKIYFSDLLVLAFSLITKESFYLLKECGYALFAAKLTHDRVSMYDQKVAHRLQLTMDSEVEEMAKLWENQVAFGDGVSYAPVPVISKIWIKNPFVRRRLGYDQATKNGSTDAGPNSVIRQMIHIIQVGEKRAYFEGREGEVFEDLLPLIEIFSRQMEGGVGEAHGSFPIEALLFDDPSLLNAIPPTVTRFSKDYVRVVNGERFLSAHPAVPKEFETIRFDDLCMLRHFLPRSDRDLGMVIKMRNIGLTVGELRRKNLDRLVARLYEWTAHVDGTNQGGERDSADDLLDSLSIAFTTVDAAIGFASMIKFFVMGEPLWGVMNLVGLVAKVPHLWDATRMILSQHLSKIGENDKPTISEIVSDIASLELDTYSDPEVATAEIGLERRDDGLYLLSEEKDDGENQMPRTFEPKVDVWDDYDFHIGKSAVYKLLSATLAAAIGVNSKLPWGSWFEGALGATASAVDAIGSASELMAVGTKLVISVIAGMKHCIEKQSIWVFFERTEAETFPAKANHFVMSVVAGPLAAELSLSEKLKKTEDLKNECEKLMASGFRDSSMCQALSNINACLSRLRSADKLSKFKFPAMGVLISGLPGLGKTQMTQDMTRIVKACEMQMGSLPNLEQTDLYVVPTNSAYWQGMTNPYTILHNDVQPVESSKAPYPMAGTIQQISDIAPFVSNQASIPDKEAAAAAPLLQVITTNGNYLDFKVEGNDWSKLERRIQIVVVLEATEKMRKNGYTTGMDLSSRPEMFELIRYSFRKLVANKGNGTVSWEEEVGAVVGYERFIKEFSLRFNSYYNTQINREDPSAIQRCNAGVRIDAHEGPCSPICVYQGEEQGGKASKPTGIFRKMPRYMPRRAMSETYVEIKKDIKEEVGKTIQDDLHTLRVTAQQGRATMNQINNHVSPLVEDYQRLKTYLSALGIAVLIMSAMSLSYSRAMASDVKKISKKAEEFTFDQAQGVINPLKFPLEEKEIGGITFVGTANSKPTMKQEWERGKKEIILSMASLTTTIADLKKKVWFNTYFVVTSKLRMRGLLYTPNVMLVTWHEGSQLANGDRLTFYRDEQKFPEEIVFNETMRCRVGEQDLCVLEVPGRSSGGLKQHVLQDDQDFQVRVTVMKEPEIECLGQVCDRKNLSATGGISRAVRVPQCTVAGDCGLAYLLHTDNGNAIVGGLHYYLHGGFSYGVLLVRKRIDEAVESIGGMTQGIKLLLSVEPDFPLHKNSVYRNMNHQEIISLGSFAKNRSQGKSRIIETWFTEKKLITVADHGKVIPSLTVMSREFEGEWVTPQSWRYAHFKDQPSYDPAALQIVLEEYAEALPEDDYQPYSLEHAVNGFEGYTDVRPTDLSTSPGVRFGYAGMKRKDVLSRDEISAELKRDVEKVIETAVHSIPVATWSSTLKDEVVSVKKELQGKYRIFLAGDLHFLLACKMVLGPIMAYCFKHWKHTFMVAKMNAASVEFTELYEWIAFGKPVQKQKYHASDSSGMDVHHRFSLLCKVITTVITIVGRKIKYQENAIKCAINLLLAHAVCIIVDRGDIIFTDAAMPSGGFATLFINSLLSVVISIYSYYIHFGKGFRDELRMGVVGDDNIGGTLNEKFNQYHVEKGSRELGYKLSPPDDKSAAIEEFLPLERAPFLKRTLRYNEDCAKWMGCLDEKSLYKTLAFYLVSGNCSYEQRMAAAADSVIREASLHGKATYQKFSALIAKGVEAGQFLFATPDYFTILSDHHKGIFSTQMVSLTPEDDDEDGIVQGLLSTMTLNGASKTESVGLSALDVLEETDNLTLARQGKLQSVNLNVTGVPSSNAFFWLIVFALPAGSSLPEVHVEALLHSPHAMLMANKLEGEISVPVYDRETASLRDWIYEVRVIESLNSVDQQAASLQLVFDLTPIESETVLTKSNRFFIAKKNLEDFTDFKISPTCGLGSTLLGKEIRLNRWFKGNVEIETVPVLGPKCDAFYTFTSLNKQSGKENTVSKKLSALAPKLNFSTGSWVEADETIGYLEMKMETSLAGPEFPKGFMLFFANISLARRGLSSKVPFLRHDTRTYRQGSVGREEVTYIPRRYLSWSGVFSVAVANVSNSVQYTQLDTLEGLYSQPIKPGEIWVLDLELHNVTPWTKLLDPPRDNTDLKIYYHLHVKSSIDYLGFDNVGIASLPASEGRAQVQDKFRRIFPGQKPGFSSQTLYNEKQIMEDTVTQESDS